MPIHPNCCESSSAPMPTTAPPSAPSRMPRRRRMARAIPNPSSATPATTATLPTAPVTVANGDRPVRRTQIVWSQLPDVTWTRYRPTPYGATPSSSATRGVVVHRAGRHRHVDDVALPHRSLDLDAHARRVGRRDRLHAVQRVDVELQRMARVAVVYPWVDRRCAPRTLAARTRAPDRARRRPGRATRTHRAERQGSSGVQWTVSSSAQVHQSCRTPRPPSQKGHSHDDAGRARVVAANCRRGPLRSTRARATIGAAPHRERSRRGSRLRPRLSPPLPHAGTELSRW